MENLFTSVPEEVPGKIAQSLGASQQTLRDNPRQSVSNQGLEGRDLLFLNRPHTHFSNLKSIGNLTK